MVSINVRKYALIVTMFLLPFLFFTGLFIVYSINGKNPIKFGEKSTYHDLIKPLQSDMSPVNILFLVKEASGDNTDAMLLIHYEPADTKVNIMSIPRDTYYQVLGSSIPKINSAYKNGGPGVVVHAVSDLLDVDAKYYIHIDIAVFRRIIDILGEVDFYIPADLDYVDPTQDLRIHLIKGMQRLDGDKAEQLLRFRKTQDGKYEGDIAKYYDGSDLKREEMQKKFIRAFIDQKMNMGSLPKISEIIDTIFKSIETDISLMDVMEYASQIVNLNSSDIQWFQLPGESKQLDYYYFIADKGKAAKIAGEHFMAGN